MRLDQRRQNRLVVRRDDEILVCFFVPFKSLDKLYIKFDCVIFVCF